MNSHSIHSLGPQNTPKAVKYLILSTLIISLISALLSRFIPIQYILGLSSVGIKHGFVWQLITYVFVQPLATGISFSFLLHLLFNLYLLWVIGTSIIERSSAKQFLALYFLSALFSGGICTFLLHAFSSIALIAGAGPSIYAILIAWMMLYPDMQISLFFVVPFKAKWLIMGLLGANLLIDLSNHDWMNFILYLSASTFGYLFAVMKWKLHGPFTALSRMERILMNFPFSWIQKWKEQGKKKSFRRSKIFDFRTGEPVLNDEEFMDAMLSKISLYGEDFLSEKEKKRMAKIAKKKKAQEL